MIKLTNASSGFEDQIIYLNAAQIVSVYEYADTPGGSLKTMIYGGSMGATWVVEESVSQVIKLINAAK